MQSCEERIAEVKRRIAERKKQQRLRRMRLAAVSGMAASLAVILGVSFFMPGIIGQNKPEISTGFATTASILGGSAALGYIVIGLLAFLLGVCVTILCFRIRLLEKEEQAEETQKGDGMNGTAQ